MTDRIPPGLLDHIEPTSHGDAARGIVAGLVLAVPVWCVIALIVWWAWPELVSQ